MSKPGNEKQQEDEQQDINFSDDEYPTGEVPLNSHFYIQRSPIEQRCYEEISKPGSLIRIKASQQTGKSSLLARILDQAKSQGDTIVTNC